METRRDVFQAIADPTRRQIIDILATQSLNVNAIAEKFKMSRQAVSLHLKILEECGLLHITQNGRERYCEARLNQLNAVSSWVEQYKEFWTGRFLALDKHIAGLKTKEEKKLKRK